MMEMLQLTPGPEEARRNSVPLNADCRNGTPWIIFYGCWVGWITVCAFAASDALLFSYVPPPAGILNACVLRKYPKQEDFFWFGATLIAGIVFGLGFGCFRAVLQHAGWKGVTRYFALGTGLCALAGTTVLAMSVRGAGSPVFYLGYAVSLLAPWLDRAILAPTEEVPREGDSHGTMWAIRWRNWALITLAVSSLVIWDGFQAHRPVDGLHEGVHLLYYQSWRAGDLPHVTVRAQYGPLYTYSLLWWLRMTGPSISTERMYFTLVQILGTWIHLLLLRAICSSPWVLLVGSLVMISHSTAMGIQFGWANALRTALALAAVVLCGLGWGTRERLRWSLVGMLLAASLLYSTEYGLAAILGCMVILAHGAMSGDREKSVKAFSWMAVAGSVSAALVLVLIFGAKVPAMIRSELGGSYIGSRLMGHGVIPFKAFPWFEGLDFAIANHKLILELAAIWLPMMGVSFFVPWIILSRGGLDVARRRLSIGLAVVAVLGQVPVLVRPNVQIAMSMPPVILFAVAWYGWARPGALVARTLALLLVVNSFLIGAPLWPLMVQKYALMYAPVGETVPELPRLGGVTASPFTSVGMRGAVKMIEDACGPGGRVYVAAPAYAHLVFLADRVGMPPYPLVQLAPSARDRDLILSVLKSARPRMALVTLEGIDVPFAMEHPDEWEYIQRNYRMARKVGSLMIFIRK
ncbi:MAG: hypothetical protein AAB152_12915 [Candidatus Coatesbacteria bacterium]